MPRSSVLSLIVLPLILATAVFVWSPRIVVGSTHDRFGPGLLDPSGTPDSAARQEINSLLDGFYSARNRDLLQEPDQGIPELAHDSGAEAFTALFHPRSRALALEMAPPVIAGQEYELRRELQVQGGIAHAWSTFHAADRKSVPTGPARAGAISKALVNETLQRSFQLIETQDGWKVLSVVSAAL